MLLELGISKLVFIYNNTFPIAWTNPLSLTNEKEFTEPIKAE